MAQGGEQAGTRVFGSSSWRVLPTGCASERVGACPRVWTFTSSARIGGVCVVVQSFLTFFLCLFENEFWYFWYNNIWFSTSGSSGLIKNY